MYPFKLVLLLAAIILFVLGGLLAFGVFGAADAASGLGLDSFGLACFAGAFLVP